MRKVFTIFLLAVMTCVSVCGWSNALAASPEQTTTAIQTKSTRTKAWEEDYLALMMESCLNGDLEAGRKAEANRNAKITALNLDMPEIKFDELYDLSKIITSEAGSSWLPMDWKMMVGEVVLNRVASVEFPDTIAEVIRQQTQYSGTRSKRFENLVPFEDCVEAASRLLEGERLINDISVVFQSNKRQGSGTYAALYDSYYGYTYFCYSNHPELYESDE